MLRRAIATLLTSLAFALPASATVVSTDFTDMWWNSSEDGWGVNVIQQAEVVFATFFVYGPDRSPRWYVAPDTRLQPGSTGTTYVFTGKLYSTTGPWFGGAYTPAAASSEVGSITFTFTSPGTASVSYNVDATNVTKNLTRLTFRVNNPTGRYLGTLVFTASPCSNSSNQGNFAIPGTITAALNGTAVAFRLDYFNTNGTSANCQFSGTWVQQGRLAGVNGGTWTCSAGSQGSFTLGAIDVQANGFNASWSATDQLCTYNGRFGGVRDVAN